ncbi:MAG: hypothetical protein HY319_08930 [Armatimonadetes bacterium]|nr:hypothetical protein [Armatimonadota bacterium]
MRRRRGFVMVLALLLTVLLLVLGLAYMGTRAVQYRRAGEAEAAAQALALADSGLTDALLKLQRDLEYPQMASDQTAISYTEELTVGGQRIGRYTVTVEGNYRVPPYSVLRITSVGEAGTDAEKAFARRALRIEVDVAPTLRDDPSIANPNYFHVLNREDLGGF